MSRRSSSSPKTDADCDGKDDLISGEEIPLGKGIYIDKQCYNIDSLNKLYNYRQEHDIPQRIPHTNDHITADYMRSLNARVSNRMPFSFQPVYNVGQSPPQRDIPFSFEPERDEPGYREGWIHFAALGQNIAAYHHVSGFSFTPRSQDAQWLVNLNPLGYPFSVVCNLVHLIEQNVWQFIPIIYTHDIAGTPLYIYINNLTGAYSYLPSIINNGNGYQWQRFGGKKTKGQKKPLKETPKKVKEAPKKAPREAPKKALKEAPKKAPKEAPKKAPKPSKAPSKTTKKP